MVALLLVFLILS